MADVEAMAFKMRTWRRYCHQYRLLAAVDIPIQPWPVMDGTNQPMIGVW